MRKVTTPLLFAIGLLTIASALPAEDRTASCSCGTPSRVPTPFVIHPRTTKFQDAAIEGFNNWNRYLTDIFQPTLNPTGALTAEQLGDGINDFSFIDFSNIQGASPGLAGYTFSQPGGAFGSFNQCPIPSDQSCGTFTEADVVMSDAFLDSNNPLGRVWSTDRPENTETDPSIFFQATATHELGHSMGFHHNFRNISVMNYYQDYASQYISRADLLEARAHFPGRVITLTDLGTYPFRYDPAGQPATPSVGDIPASRGEDAVSLTTASPSTVAPGAGLQIKNWTLENLSTSTVTNARLRFYLSTDRNITTSDIYLGGVLYSNFTTWSDSANGGCGSFNNDCTFTVPANTPIGSYYVGAIAMYGDSLAQDGVSYNNSWSLPDRISVSTSSGGSGNPLSLLNGRFSVTLNAKDPRSGKTGVGVPITEPGNNVFGYFSIPDLTSDPNNPEVFIKILDARSVNNKFWVFYGSLTDFQLTLSVRDNTTGAVKTYDRAGLSLCGGADTSAFNLPGDVIEFRAMTAVPVDPSAVADSTSSVDLASSNAALASRFPVKSTATCGVDALCLLNRHFGVVLAAADPRSGKTGVGKALPKSDLFGYFSIPDLTSDPNNPEVFVKMLDGRTVNGKYWIFIGGLTDFELLVRVYDLTTSNPQQFKDLHRDGRSVCGGVDTSVF